MIYTSYFGKMNKFPSNFEPICIARWKPKWYEGKVLLALAPPKQLLHWWRASDKNEASRERYIKWYKRSILSGYDPRAIERIVKHIANGKIPVLMCFEKDGFCHRHIVADWLKENGIECEEWNE